MRHYYVAHTSNHKVINLVYISFFDQIYVLHSYYISVFKVTNLGL